MIQTEEICFTVYKCSRCSFLNTFPARVLTHIRNGVRCTGAVVQTLDGRANYTPHILPESKVHRPGPKGVDAYNVLQDRIPWDDVSTRVEYLVGHPDVLMTILKTKDPSRTLGNVFAYAWGNKAPETFRSFIRDFYCCWVRTSDGKVEKIGTVTAFEARLRNTVLDVLLEVYNAVRMQCSDGDEMVRLFDRTWMFYFEPDHLNIRLYDILSKNELFHKYQKRIVPSSAENAKDVETFWDAALGDTNPRANRH